MDIDRPEHPMEHELQVQWHLRLRATPGQRMASRVLQVFETQGVEPSQFRLRVLAAAMHLDAIFTTSASKARRIGLLLRRLHHVLSAVWLPLPEDVAPYTTDRVALSLYSSVEADIDTNPDSEFWRIAPSVGFAEDNYGKSVSSHDTEVRLRWSDTHLYFLFICEYQDLALRPSAPSVDQPTPELWNHDVAEVFVGPSLHPLSSYSEFELSPRGEWLDLQIDCLPLGGVAAKPLDSKFASSARLEQYEIHWYGALSIPMASIVSDPLQRGDRLKINLFRSQGTTPVELTWQPTHDPSFHVPSSFGDLILIE